MWYLPNTTTDSGSRLLVQASCRALGSLEAWHAQSDDAYPRVYLQSPRTPCSPIALDLNQIWALAFFPITAVLAVLSRVAFRIVFQSLILFRKRILASECHTS